MRKSTLTLLLTGILSLVYVNGIAWRYATIRNEGKTVYLQLAPVDPISLVQGQYMQLAFDIETWHDDLQDNDLRLFAANPNAGALAVLKLDANQVGTVSRLIPENPSPSLLKELNREYGSSGYALLSVEVDSEFRHHTRNQSKNSDNEPRTTSIRLRQNSFLFKENTPETYDQARYGIFRVTRTGKYVLIDLAGEDFRAMTAVKK